MIYINQLGHCELGRGESLDDAIEDAQYSYPDLSRNEVVKYWPYNPKCYTDGDVVWTDEPDSDYNN